MQQQWPGSAPRPARPPPCPPRTLGQLHRLRVDVAGVALPLGGRLVQREELRLQDPVVHVPAQGGAYGVWRVVCGGVGGGVWCVVVVVGTMGAGRASSCRS
jgi:hypothetical protein